MHLQQDNNIQLYTCISTKDLRSTQKLTKNGAAIHLGIQPLMCRKFQMVVASVCKSILDNCIVKIGLCTTSIL